MLSNESNNINNHALSHKLKLACNHNRVLVGRTVRSYVSWHLNRSSTLLRFVFALFHIFFLYFLCFLFVLLCSPNTFSVLFTSFLCFSFIFSGFFFSQLYQQPIDPTYETCYDPHLYYLSPTYRSNLKTRI